MRKRIPSKLRLLSVREVQTACDGDSSDGGGLVLRVGDRSATWEEARGAVDQLKPHERGAT
jgi:hypothetical protein